MLWRQDITQQGDGVGAQGQAHGDVVLDDFLTFAHAGKLNERFFYSFALQLAGEQWQGTFPCDRACLPERFAAGQAD